MSLRLEVVFRRNMNKKFKIALAIILPLLFITVLFLLVRGHTIDLFSPQGQIAEKQRNLLIFASALSLLVVVPVYVLAFGIAWKYREGNKKAKYAPNWGHSKKLEITWWTLPTLLIIVLSVVTWNSSHDLDPFKPLASNKKPLTVQVVALEWKWLFIYPEQNIATVNTLTIPEKTPVNFQITADAPMNSFWIPQLGGQIYAMSGMSTKLHLEADQTGIYRGSSANLSGDGFAGMNFETHSVSNKDFDAWVSAVQDSNNFLSLATYNQLAEQSKNNPPANYSGVQTRLYDTILGRYMSHDMSGMNHGGSE